MFELSFSLPLTAAGVCVRVRLIKKYYLRTYGLVIALSVASVDVNARD